jgi:hypothetical protein
MGLDAVELIVEIEKRFQIDIEDEDAQYLETVGKLASYVSEKTAKPKKRYSEVQVLRIVIEMLESNYGVPKGKAISTSHFVDDLGFN